MIKTGLYEPLYIAIIWRHGFDLIFPLCFAPPILMLRSKKHYITV